ncbi:aquaporin [Paenibacillus kribbensis]|uniref:aquaporin n=1 Tax=Paenibacillus kribbensis TaxID=172713 RepID=UPI000A00B160
MYLVTYIPLSSRGIFYLLKGSYAYNPGWTTINIAWGLAVTMAVYAVGNISGGHLNPVLTSAFALNGSFPWNEAPTYIAGQILRSIG